MSISGLKIDSIGVLGPNVRPGTTPAPDPTADVSEIRLEATAAPVATGLDLIGILSAIGETAYIWDVTTDHMSWESNVCSVLGVRTVAMALRTWGVAR